MVLKVALGFDTEIESGTVEFGSALGFANDDWTLIFGVTETDSIVLALAVAHSETRTDAVKTLTMVQRKVRPMPWRLRDEECL